MTTISRIFAGLTAVLALCFAGTAQAKSHLNRDELKIMSAASVQVIFVGTDVPLGAYLDANHRAISMGGAQGAIMDSVNQGRMDEFENRLAPYRATLDKLALPQMDRDLTRQALASVAWLNKLPWLDAKRAPLQDFFVRDNAKLSQAQIVIFIEPQLLMAVNTQQLLMTCSIDIETVNPPGSGKTIHYDQSEFTVELDIDPKDLPPRASTPHEDEDDDDVHVEQMFINDAAGLKQLLAKLTPQFQQKLYYFFSGQDTLPPPAASAAGAK